MYFLEEKNNPNLILSWELLVLLTKHTLHIWTATTTHMVKNPYSFPHGIYSYLLVSASERLMYSSSMRLSMHFLIYAILGSNVLAQVLISSMVSLISSLFAMIFLPFMILTVYALIMYVRSCSNFLAISSVSSFDAYRRKNVNMSACFQCVFLYFFFNL